MRRSCLLLTCGLLAAACAQADTPAAQAPPSGWQATLKAVTDACKGETPQICPGMSTDTALACLQSNIDKLTPGCKSAVTDATKSALGLLK